MEKMRSSIKSFTSRNKEKDGIPIDHIGKTAKIYNLGTATAIYKTLSPADHYFPSKCVRVEIAGLNDLFMLPCIDDESANLFILDIMRRRADLRTDSYLVIKEDGQVDFIEIQKVDMYM